MGLLLAVAGGALAYTPTEVVVQRRQLLVHGAPFTIRGVGDGAVPICETPDNPPYGDYFTQAYHAMYERDLPLLRAMGANVVRLWGWNNTADHTDFLDQAYNGGVRPIYVIVAFWMGPGTYADLCDQATRTRVKADFLAMIRAVKDHPAVLMWSIGNELNADWMYGSRPDCLYSLIEELAAAAHAEEGEHYHPVTTPLLDAAGIMGTIAQYDGALPHLDVWGINVYRGCTFGRLFDDYAAASGKPLVILEYGVDAYDSQNCREYEDVQADCDATLWCEVVARGELCVGASIMAYRDEWWKGQYSAQKPNCADPSCPSASCPDYDPCCHSTCGYATAAHPDGFSNEEWWGIMRAVDNGSGPDIMQPRQVYYALQHLWSAGDLNCDGGVDFDDINPFVLALVGRGSYEAKFPHCVWLNGDIDGDGDVNFDDINPFVRYLVRGACP